MSPTPWMAILAGVALVGIASCERPQTQETVIVFAAASLADALGEVAADFERVEGTRVRLSFGASGAVARQVQAGAPADVVILADPVWMDRLDATGDLGERRLDLLRNELVIIAPADGGAPGEGFQALANGGRLAIGDPESVPAGAYARGWLQASGLWDGLEDRLVFATDVRGVRGFVARGEAALGVVYRSDVVGRDDVRIVRTPPQSQPLILYPAAETARAGPQAAVFLDHLATPAAADVFRRYGFDPLT